MEWKFDSERPVYVQLVEQILLRILTGIYQPGQRLPAVRELASEATVNPNTIQRAFNELEGSGLIVTQRTAGRFITEDTCIIDKQRRSLVAEFTSDFVEHMKMYGFTKDEIIEIIKET